MHRREVVDAGWAADAPRRAGADAGCGGEAGGVDVLVVAEGAVDDEVCARLSVFVLGVAVGDEAGRGGGHAEVDRWLDLRLGLFGFLPEQREGGGAGHERALFYERGQWCS